MQQQRNYDRHDRITANLMPVVAEFVRLEANTDPLITITRVSTSVDYRRMTMFFTTIPDEKQDIALIFLKRKAGDLRTYIKNKMRLKTIPHIEFEIDYGERHRQHIDEIAREIEEGSAE